MERQSDINLLLFFTRGVSLDTWEQVGMFEREVAMYRKLAEMGVNVSFITYGGAKDRQLAKQIPEIRVHANRLCIPPGYYDKLIPFLHAPALRRADVLKTNQTDGGAIALTSARLWNKPLIARCGYMFSEFAANNFGRQSDFCKRACALEKRVFAGADHVVVTTEAMAEDVRGRVPDAAEHLTVIPNYVDTDLFKPQLQKTPDIDVLFIGRLEAQKNVEALLHAVEPLEIRTTIVGKGSLAETVLAAGERIQWLERVAHEALPQLFARSRLFVLPSLWEGHPKTLIEAMACGMSVIGGDSPGIREIIRHGENGWLCATDPLSIREAINHLLATPDLCAKLGENARRFAVEAFSLERVAEMELSLLRRLAS